MSMRATGWAWEQERLSSSAKFVLLALADQANGSYDVPWAGYRWLAWRTRLTRNTLARIMGELAEAGLIEIAPHRIHLNAPAAPPPDEGEYVTMDGAGSITTAQRSTTTRHRSPVTAQRSPTMRQRCTTVAPLRVVGKQRSITTVHRSPTTVQVPAEPAVKLAVQRWLTMTQPCTTMVLRSSAHIDGTRARAADLRSQDQDQDQDKYSKKSIFPELFSQLEDSAHSKPSAKKGSRAKSGANWAEKDRWLLDYLQQEGMRTFEAPHLSSLLDAEFWDDVSELTNGISREFVEREFVAMRRWFAENPGRRPTPRGTQRFVRRWLERAEEHNRRQVPTQWRQAHQGYQHAR